MDCSDRPFVSRLAEVEVTSACARRMREGAMLEEQFRQSVAILKDELSERYTVIELDRNAMSLASRLIESHTLRTLDAIQLSCALIARENSGDSAMTFVSWDSELNAAARAERFTLFEVSGS